MKRLDLTSELTDGTVALRRPEHSDVATLIAGRDSDFRRFMGEGSSDPDPTAVVLNSARQIVGWIDYDLGRDWLTTSEVNIGYSTFAEHRGRGFARRALLLLLLFLAENRELTTASLLIDPENAASLALGHRAGFELVGEVDGQLLYKRVPG